MGVRMHRLLLHAPTQRHLQLESRRVAPTDRGVGVDLGDGETINRRGAGFRDSSNTST